MKTKLLALGTLIFAAFTSAQVLAHHSFAAEFDANAPVNLSGIVTKVDWSNPHAYFYIEVENGNGSFEEWAFELGSPTQLKRRGWTRNSLAIGSKVMVTGTRARDGSPKANAVSVILAANCQQLFAGSSQSDVAEDVTAFADCKP
jgi:hypothetical protein